jgi:hypothetical protein
MNLNDLLKGKDIDPHHVLVLRHRPNAPELNKVLPWLAAEKPDLFNAYQQTQGERVERAMKAMTGTGYVASFLGREPGKALFVGLYSIGKSKPLSREKFWQVPAYVQLKEFLTARLSGSKVPGSNDSTRGCRTVSTRTSCATKLPEGRTSSLGTRNLSQHSFQMRGEPI